MGAEVEIIQSLEVMPRAPPRKVTTPIVNMIHKSLPSGGGGHRHFHPGPQSSGAGDDFELHACPSWESMKA